MKVASEVAAWLRKLDATSAALFILVVAAVALFRLPEIKNSIAAQEHTSWIGLFEPIGWGAVVLTLKVLGMQTAVRLRKALSPKHRFRQLARQADALAAALSNGGNYYPHLFSFEGELPSLEPRDPRPQLVAAIATFKADLNQLGVRRTPANKDINGWKNAVPELKARMRVGDLASAQSHDWTTDCATAANRR